MSALVKKEIRLLLPSFGIALLLALSVWLIPTQATPESGLRSLLMLLPLLLCPALVLMTALDSFGREVSSNTFSNLLAQPMSRSRIWWTKTSLLAAALLILFGIWWLSFLLHLPGQFWGDAEARDAMFTGTVLLLVTIYSGALWSVLWLRQVGGAFWITLIVPSAVAGLTAYLTEKFGQETHAERNVVIALIAYSVAGFFLARRLFLRAQDVHWTGGEISLPAWFKLPRGFVPTLGIANRRPRLALILKEFQLHQSQFVIAGVLAILHLIIIVVRNTYAYVGLKESYTLQFVTLAFWTLWLFMPLLIGCAALAEERKLGTLETQLCLPVRRRMQFLIKFGVALALAIFFGVAVPVLFEGGRILPDLQPNLEKMGPAFNYPGAGPVVQVIVSVLIALGPVLPFVPMFIFAVSFVSLAFYSSSLARNTLQAIAPAVLSTMIAWAFVMGARFVEEVVPYPLWRGRLIYLIGLPVLIVSVAWLTYWNFKRVLVGWPVWRRNLTVLVLALTFVITTTTAIYQRAWEFVTRLEPEHGSARISHLNLPTIQSKPIMALTVTFPDGRLWRGNFTSIAAPGRAPRQALIASQFLAGSNWVNVLSIGNEQVAIQSDGSLWLIELPPVADSWKNNKPVAPTLEPAKLARIGIETNWQRVVQQGWSPAVLLLKTDGTLWDWGTNTFDFKQPWPRLASSAIRRLGTESDWADMASAGSSIYLWKKNGQAWAINPLFQGPKKSRVEKGPGIQMERYQRFDGMKWRNLARGQPFQTGVRDDGTLWGWGLRGRIFQDPNLSSGQIGAETNWVSVACGETTTVALKSDGSLWKWDFSYKRQADRNAATPIRLSGHNDWVAVAGWWHGVVGLAADGSLWLWRFPERSNPQDFQPLLRISRKPQFIGNIFERGE